MHDRRAISLIRPFGLIAAVLLAAFAGFGPSARANDTPGNNGTVKIHDGATENDPGEVRNEPHVCTFHLHFYFGDPEQVGSWEIQEWPPTGDMGAVVLSGTYDTAGDGEDRQPAEGVFQLPDGHYKLFWDGDLDASRHDKMKVFWVECALPSEVPSATPSEVPSATPSEAPPAMPSEAPSATPTGSELAIESGGAPSGGVEDITGTPPPTDVAAVAPTSSDTGWRAVLIGIAAIVALAAFLVPNAIPATPRSSRRPGR